MQVDKGTEKLYIVVSAATPLIWDFQGDTSRISQLVLAGSVHTQGLTGSVRIGAANISADKILYRDHTACGMRHASSTKPESVELSLSALDKLIGRRPDLLYNNYKVSGLHIFAGRINDDISKGIETRQKKTPQGFDPALWAKHITHMSGGIADFTNKKVVSDAPVTAYEVLPKWAGFAKLAFEGAVIPVRGNARNMVTIPRADGQSVSLEGIEKIVVNRNTPQINFGTSSAIKIVKHIPYYPSGLHGGYATTIIIGKGVETPKGDAGHSKIISEETGEAIK